MAGQITPPVDPYGNPEDPDENPPTPTQRAPRKIQCDGCGNTYDTVAEVVECRRNDQYQARLTRTRQQEAKAAEKAARQAKRKK